MGRAWEGVGGLCFIPFLPIVSPQGQGLHLVYPGFPHPDTMPGTKAVFPAGTGSVRYKFD